MDATACVQTAEQLDAFQGLLSCATVLVEDTSEPQDVFFWTIESAARVVSGLRAIKGYFGTDDADPAH